MVKNFKELDKLIKTTYYNSDDDTIKDFLIPLLKSSKTYKRETYSFSSAIFSLINSAISDLIKNDCKIQYVVGFELERDELDAIGEGLDDELDFIEKSIKNEFGNIENLINKLDKHSREIYRYRLTVLSYLISKKILEIKVGFVSKNGKIKNPSKFKFHPKVMIFEDFEGNFIVANGSTNESFGAHARNEESFDVFKSWNENTSEYFKRHYSQFDNFWNNYSENIKTININKILENEILLNYKRKFKSKDEIIKLEEELNKLFEEEQNKKLESKNEPKIKLWEHQTKVIENWFYNNNRGIIKFATGAGKTLTALSAMNQLFEKNGRLITVISTPYKALSEQWYEEIVEKFPDYTTILAYENQQKWLSSFNRLVNSYNIGINKKIIVVSVNKTFSTDSFQALIEKINDKKLIIADEVHHFGADNLNENLSYSFEYRLGLSATPERYNDLKGTNNIIKYFGDILTPEFSLADALNKGILSKYKYHPLIVDLRRDEEGGYWKISEEIKEIWEKTSEEDERYEKSKSLFNKRNEILNTASQKLVKLRELLVTKNPEKISNSLIYCHNIEHLEKVSSVLFNLNISNARITSREPTAEERRHSFNLFKKNQRQTLLAINCLDEGIDVPAIDTSFVLASSGNPKQFIQRRGRLLRKIRDANGNVIEKDVNIYDFISFPPLDSTGSLPAYEEEIISREIRRIKEFAELADNKDDALSIIESYLRKIKLDLK